MNKLIEKIIGKKLTCYFISPHLDDAVLSAGGLISYLSDKTNVKVITVFTEAGSGMQTLSAKQFVKQCGFKPSEVKDFYEKRRYEDKAVFEKYGVQAVHMGFIDALWRRKNRLSFLLKFLSKWIAEFAYVYPTHRLHVSKGKISDEDKETTEKIQEKLLKIIGGDNRSIVFCPVGVGNHVDHIIVRQVCSDIFENVIYWEDGLYNLKGNVDKKFLRRPFNKITFDQNKKEREKLFKLYKTQFGNIFGGTQDLGISPETYYVKNNLIKHL